MGVYHRQVTHNYDQAMKTYEALIKQFPADGHGLNNLANAYFDKLDFRQTLDLSQRLLKIYPTSPLYRGNNALYAMYAGDFDHASSVAQKLVDEKQAAYDTYLPLAMAAGFFATIACIVPLSSERNTMSAVRPRSDRCVSMCWMLVQVR